MTLCVAAIDQLGNILRILQGSSQEQIDANTPPGATQVPATSNLMPGSAKYNFTTKRFEVIPPVIIPPAMVVFRRRILMTESMKGIVSFTYGSIPFLELPVISVTITDPSGAGKLTYQISAESLSGCTVVIQRGRTLPLVGSLFGFDVFSGGVVAGVTVNLIAGMVT